MSIFKILKTYKHQLTKQQYKTLKGQAIAGDTLGAMKGLNKILQRQSKIGGDNNSKRKEPNTFYKRTKPRRSLEKR